MQRPSQRYVQDPRQRHRRNVLRQHAVDPEHAHVRDHEPVPALAQPQPERADY